MAANFVARRKRELEAQAHPSLSSGPVPLCRSRPAFPRRRNATVLEKAALSIMLIGYNVAARSFDPLRPSRPNEAINAPIS